MADDIFGEIEDVEVAKSVSNLPQNETKQVQAKNVPSDDKNGLKRKIQRSETKSADIEVETSIVRNVPKVLLQQIRVEFPKATNNTDALVAYLMCHGDGHVVDKTKMLLTPEQKALVASWDGSVYTQLVDALSEVSSRLDKLMSTSDIMELLMSFMVFDRLGFRRDNPNTPKDSNFREDGVLDVNLSARRQCEGFKRDISITEGRPIK